MAVKLVNAALTLAVVLLVWSVTSFGDSSSANLSVTATVVRNCTIATGAVAFGNYDPVVTNATTDLDATGGVIIACTKGTAATIGLGPGQYASGSLRRMSDGGEFLQYEMFSDSSRTVVWTDSGGGLLDTGSAPSKAPRTFTVYSRIAAGQDVSVGAFSDLVVATVNF